MQLLSDSKHHSNSQKFLRHSGHGDDLHQNIETMFHSKATDYESNNDLIHRCTRPIALGLTQVEIPRRVSWTRSRSLLLQARLLLPLRPLKWKIRLRMRFCSSRSVVFGSEASITGFSISRTSFVVEMAASVAMKSGIPVLYKFTLY
jgi:hypothetical protein